MSLEPPVLPGGATQHTARRKRAASRAPTGIRRFRPNGSDFSYTAPIRPAPEGLCRRQGHRRGAHCRSASELAATATCAIPESPLTKARSMAYLPPASIPCAHVVQASRSKLTGVIHFPPRPTTSTVFAPREEARLSTSSPLRSAPARKRCSNGEEATPVLDHDALCNHSLPTLPEAEIGGWVHKRLQDDPGWADCITDSEAQLGRDEWAECRARATWVLLQKQRRD